MPLYDWKCDKCGQIKSVVHSFDNSDKPPRQCYCGSFKFTKIITAPNVQKGDSWGGGKGNW